MHKKIKLMVYQLLGRLKTFVPTFKALSYKDSGVDIDAGDDLVQRIKPLSRGTQRPGVVGGLGGFGGLFRLNEVSKKNFQAHVKKL